MFSAVISQSTDRVRQASALLAHITAIESQKDSANDDILKIQKGLLFIAFYSSIEFTITACVSNLLSLIAAEPREPLHYKKYYLCSLLNAELRAIIDAGKKTQWEKKANLFDRMFSNQPVTVDNAVFPTDGINIGINQLSGIWKMFHLPDPVLPEGVHPWLLKEIKEHRNAIAHGREKAGSIGGRFTAPQMSDKLKAVELLCAHIVGSFEELYNRNEFLNTGA